MVSAGNRYIVNMEQDLNKIFLNHRNSKESCKDLVRLSVLEISAPITYKNSRQEQATFNTASCCNIGSARPVKVFIYDATKLAVLQSHNTVLMFDFFVREDSLSITSKTSIFPVKEDVIPENLREATMKLNTPSTTESTVLEAAMSPKKTNHTVTGIIAQASPTEKKRVRSSGEEIPFKKVKLLDMEGQIDVCLWRDPANMPLKRGDSIRLQHFTVTDTFDSEGKTVPALTNKQNTSAIEFIPENADLKNHLQTVPEISISQPEATILSITSLDSYKSCIKTECYRKKLVESRCPACGIMYNTGSSTSVLGKVLLSMEGKCVAATVFTQQVEELCKILNVTFDVLDIKVLQENIIKNLPKNVVCFLHGNKVSKFKCIS